MKTIFEHIEYAKGKPHHVRKRIAFSVAAGVSGLIALVWLIGGLSSGAFAIQGSTFAESTERSSVTTAGSETDSTAGGIAGAAAALPAKNAPARIEIIDSATSSSAKGAAEQTTIPF